MKHLTQAVAGLSKDKQKFIKIENGQDQGKANTLIIEVQQAPVGEVGVTGLQALDLITLSRLLIESLNGSYPCESNAKTIINLYSAEFYQERRTEDRKDRGVEGKNEA